jgi:hypothetical protein
MIQGQRENLAKYPYDLSKIVFAATVVGNLIAGQRFNMVVLILGDSGAYLLLWVGFLLDGVRDEG